MLFPTLFRVVVYKKVEVYEEEVQSIRSGDWLDDSVIDLALK